MNRKSALVIEKVLYLLGLTHIDPAKRPDEDSTYLYGKAGQLIQRSAQQSWAVLRKSYSYVINVLVSIKL